MMTDTQMVRAIVAFVMVVALIVFLILVPFINAVSIDAALVRFKEMAGTQDVTIVRHSSTIPLIGSTRHVTFELKVNGKLASGKCDTDAVGPMICQYFPGQLTPPQ